jgi:hypothetical protein
LILVLDGKMGKKRRKKKMVGGKRKIQIGGKGSNEDGENGKSGISKKTQREKMQSTLYHPNATDNCREFSNMAHHLLWIIIQLIHS